MEFLIEQNMWVSGEHNMQVPSRGKHMQANIQEPTNSPYPATKRQTV